jgi:hypothetical protein
MVQMRVDDAVFGPINEKTELVNGDGKVLGYFIPALSPHEELRRKAFAEYDPEKARRRRESPEGGFTTEEVLAHLQSLGKS